MEFGTELVWRVFRQLRTNEAEQIEQLQSIIDNFATSVLFFAFLILGLGGRLLPVWMFINSLQLIMHTQLLETELPANLHYFMNHYLGLLRLNTESGPGSLESKLRERG